MNGVVAQFHQKYPQYAKTKVVVDWIPWGNRVTDWTNALTSGKGGPDITELGNTDTPGIASQGALANISSEVKAWSHGSGIIPGNLANDVVNGQTYAVPWFGGVRGIWYRKDEFAKAGITAAPTTWAQLVSDAKALQKKYPGTFGLGAPSNYTNAIVSFIWGAGGQVATQSGGKWTAKLTTPQAEAGIKFYQDLYLTQHVSPSKYIGQTELGAPGGDLGRLERGLRPRQAGHVHRRSLGAGRADRGEQEVRRRTGPRSRSPARTGRTRPRPSPAGPTSASGSRASTPQADWYLVSLMDSPANSTTFANAAGFFPQFTAKLKGGAYASNPVMAGFAKAAAYTQIAPLNSKNWATADATDAIIPTMMKSLMQGANFSATVSKANTELQNVLNTGSETG